jgi:hypothetical protein
MNPYGEGEFLSYLPFFRMTVNLPEHRDLRAEWTGVFIGLMFLSFREKCGWGRVNNSEALPLGL